jgi:mRNA interferase RelE/StbE
VKKIVFSQQARADVRRLERDTAMRIFATLHRFAQTGVGDIKRLREETNEFRLHVGAYRVRFTEEANTIRIIRVLHRKEAYR